VLSATSEFNMRSHNPGTMAGFWNSI